eukprot:COSAG02_NODE_13351_length_1405_cov_10096.023737_2_plen_20_part_01
MIQVGRRRERLGELLALGVQ